MSENTVVLYLSKYGATKRYAQWIAQCLNCPIFQIDSIHNCQLLNQYDNIIIGGGIYMGTWRCTSFIKQYYGSLKKKNLVFFAVGAMAHEKTSKWLLSLNPLFSNVPFFYLRGTWESKSLTPKDDALIKHLIVSAKKKDERHLANWEYSLLSLKEKDYDWIDSNAIFPLIEKILTQQTRLS